MASKQSRDWIVEIDNFQGGFAPAFFVDDYPSYGNKNMAGNMKNVDISNPIGLVPGPNMQSISGSPSDLISQFIDYAIEEDTTYAIGNTGYVYQLSSSTLTNDNNFPHLISGAVLGSSIAYYRGNIYYSWHNNSVGDVGRYDGNAFDDDFMSTIPTSADNIEVSEYLPLLVYADKLWIGNGYYVSLYEETGESQLFTKDAFDLPPESKIVALAQAGTRIWVGAIKSNGGSNDGVISSIYIWDGNSPSWEDEIVIKGKIGTLYNRNNIIYVFWQDQNQVSRLSIIDPTNLSLRDIVAWSGTLPDFGQVSEHKNHIIWVSNNKIYAFGAIDGKLLATFFQLASPYYSTCGAISTAFSSPLVASTNNTSYNISYFNDYTNDAYWTSLLFNASANSRMGYIDEVVVFFDTLQSGNNISVIIEYDYGNGEYTENINYATLGSVKKHIFRPNVKCYNFRIKIDWSNNSTTFPVKIRGIKVVGHTVD